MTNVREIRTANTAIADGLEAVAAYIRSGKVAARCVVVVIDHVERDYTSVGAVYFGNPCTGPQLVGMLECAKFNVLAEQP